MVENNIRITHKKKFALMVPEPIFQVLFDKMKIDLNILTINYIGQNFAIQMIRHSLRKIYEKTLEIRILT